MADTKIEVFTPSEWVRLWMINIMTKEHLGTCDKRSRSVTEGHAIR